MSLFIYLLFLKKTASSLYYHVVQCILYDVMEGFSRGETLRQNMGKLMRNQQVL